VALEIVVLPAQAFTEREGSYTSGERRVQRFYPVVPARPEARPDFAIAAQIGERLEIELEGRAASLVMERIAWEVPDYADLNYDRLAEVRDQWPLVGSRYDRYYGGKAYQNAQGLGVQLQPAAQRGEEVPLAWLEPPEARPVPEGGFLAVPITRLYDRGRTLLPSRVLDPRLTEPYVVLHPDDAARLGVGPDGMVALRLNGTTQRVAVCLEAGLPGGVVLVPRSLGLAVAAPVPVEVQAAARSEASAATGD